MDVEQHNHQQIEALNQRGGRALSIVDLLHAGTLDELTDILCAPPLEVPPATLGRVGLILFIHVVRIAGSPQRRVATFWETDGSGRHRLVFRWDAKTDSFSPVGELHASKQLGDYEEFLQNLLDRREVEIEAVRRSVVEFYRRGK